MSETRVTGSFRYSDVFQIRPMYPDAPILEWALGHHPFLLEYRYNIPDVSETKYNPELPEEVLTPLLDDEYSSKVKKWILIVLSMFSKSRVFQYERGLDQHQWFIRLPSNSKGFEALPPLWGYAGYQHKGAVARIVDDYSHPDNVLIHLVDTNHYYGTETPRTYVVGQTSYEFELPDRISSFIDAYMYLSDELRESFLSSCFLFDQGIELFHQTPSLAFAACVSSLETLIEVDHKGQADDRCKGCGQLKFNARQKFLEFIKKYGNDSPETRKIADRIYNRRSRILHKGHLFLGEIEPRTIEGAADWLNDHNQRKDVIRFFRTCIINWLITKDNAQRTL
jgi:hypothetical protein